MPAASAAQPTRPSSPSASRTRWAVASTPIARFHGTRPLAVADHLDAAPERIGRLLQQFSLPSPAEQPLPPAAQMGPQNPNQGRDHPRAPVPAAGGASKSGATPPLLPDSRRLAWLRRI